MAEAEEWGIPEVIAHPRLSQGVLMWEHPGSLGIT